METLKNILLEEQKEKNLNENLELLKRMITLKKRVQKTLLTLKGEN